MDTLVSAGGVVYRRVDGRIEAVLCGLATTRAARDAGTAGGQAVDGSPSEGFRWSLAKGTPDPGESLEETALREVREETGLEVEIDSPLGTIEYWFMAREPNVRYHKTVYFYLMSAVGGGTELHDPEFDVVRWFTSDEALRAMNYPNEADILRRALETISQR